MAKKDIQISQSIDAESQSVDGKLNIDLIFSINTTETEQTHDQSSKSNDISQNTYDPTDSLKLLCAFPGDPCFPVWSN